MGGDEFIVYCQNVTDEAVIEGKSRYINDHIVESAREFMGEDMSIPIGASIGCALAPEDGSDFLTLFKKADKALYSVKQNGKHGYAIYHENANDAESSDVDATDLGSAITILTERSPAKGALTLPMEQFRLIYQFLVRVNANYQKQMHIVLFSLKNKDSDEMPPSEITDAFLENMSQSLRQSDVITQSSKNQFLLILLKTTPPNAQLVIDRVMSKWVALPESEKADVTYEMKEMD